MTTLTHEERLVVNSELQKKGKNLALAYILLIFLGQLGIHRFYLNRKGSAIAQLVLTIVGYLTVLVIIGFIPLVVVWVWIIVDLFLIPNIFKEENSKIEEQILTEIRKD